jgi:transglutaminase-like putative cysteine protease
VDVEAPLYNAPDPTVGIADGSWILLFDRQIDVTAEGDEQYEHLAVKVLDPVGVDAYSQINMRVDPTFQSLTIHWLRIVRQGTVIDQRESARITAVPEENDLTNRIYNGRYSIDALLEDVRVGDIIEYAYTVSSRERLFPGHFAATLSTAWGIPVHRQRIRIRSPLERPLRYHLSESEVAPVADIRDGSHELVLEWTDIAPIPSDADRPGWYDTWPSLEVSDLQSWADVSRLVSPLFAARSDASSLVTEVVNEIRAVGGTPAQQALRALQYVQEEISYASIAIGRGTHEPADPDTVLRRRFGDCKDKSLLLATILQQFGIDAQPALVHSFRGRALDNALPTPYAFDHAIVRAQIGAQVYWLDATSSTRYSPLSTDDGANFERALLVNGVSPELQVIPPPGSDTRTRELLMEFDLRAGLEEEASLAMTTWYRGSLADAMRPVLARGSREQRELDYTNYIARYYAGARIAGPIVIEDDKSSNVIEVREFYTLPRSFTGNDDGLLTFQLHADEIYPFGEPLRSSVRQAPLAIEYPIRVQQNLIVHLPEEWPVEPDTMTVENPAFRYHSEVGYSAQTLKLGYSYEALADHVEPAALDRYQEDRKRLYDDTGYVLSYDPNQTSTFAIAPVPAVTVLLAFAFSIWGSIRWLYRYDPEPRTAEEGAPGGIRGWLLLPTLGLIITPLTFAWLISVWVPFFNASTWEVLPDIVAGNGNVWRITAKLMLLGTVAGAVVLFVANMLAIVLLFRKRSSFPVIFIAFSWIAVIYGSLVAVWMVLSGFDTETENTQLISDIIRQSVITLLWTVYMLNSSRVGATFVKRAPVGPLPAPGIASAA